MKRYFIKVINTATESNPGFKAGTQHELWYGKQEKLIAKFYPDEPAPSFASIIFGMKEYGFKNKSEAMKAFNYHMELIQGTKDFGYWNCECSVEETEVDREIR